MRAGEIMTREFVTVHPDSLIGEVAVRLEGTDPDPIPVCEDQRLIGMLVPQDIASHNKTNGPGRSRIRVRDVMAPDILFCLEATEVTEAAALMNENHVRRLPVVSADRKLV